MTTQRSRRCCSRRSCSSSMPNPSGRRMSAITTSKRIGLFFFWPLFFFCVVRVRARFSYAGGGLDAIAFAQQGQFVQGAQIGFVVYDKYASSRGVHGDAVQTTM